MNEYVIGVDGGGTKTEVTLVDRQGKVIARIRGGSTNLQGVGAEKLKSEMLFLFDKLTQKTNVSPDKIGAIFMGLAGAGRKSDQDTILALFNDTKYDGKIVVDSDAIIALAGAFGNKPGIILIAGTGSICFGMSEDGDVVRSGGWGYMLGDEGSGYFIGREAIMASLKDHDGRGEQTMLKGELVRKLDLKSIDQIIPHIYQNKLDRVAIANLAPLVFEMAKKDDVVSQQIVKRTGGELGKMAGAVARKLKFENSKIRIGLIGSIFKQKEVLANEISKELYEISWDIEIKEPEYDPSVGASILALQNMGVDVNDHLLENLKKYTGIDIN